MKSIKLNSLIKALVSLVLVFFLIKKINIENFRSLESSIIKVVAFAVMITTLSFFMMSIRWMLLCKENKINAGLINLFKFYIIGAFYNIFLPGAIGGDIVRTKKMMSKYHVNLKTASKISIIERLSGLYMLFVLGSLGLLFGKIPGVIDDQIDKTYLIIVLLLFIFAIPFLKMYLKRKDNAISYITIFSVLLISLLSQLGDVIISFLLCNYFELNIDFSQLLVIMPIVYFATVLPISLGGLGVRESVFVGVLTLYSVDTSVAVLISFLMYFTKVIVGVIGWSVYMWSKDNSVELVK